MIMDLLSLYENIGTTASQKSSLEKRRCALWFLQNQVIIKIPAQPEYDKTGDLLFEIEQHLGDCGLTREAAHNPAPPENPNYNFQEEQIMNTIIIRNETPADYRTVEHLTREAFWNVYRPGCLEHYVLHTFRSDPAFVPELDLVMELDGRIIGHVMYVRSAIQADDGRTIPMMTFGPICIDPALQRKGYGKMLLDYSMEKARELGAGALAITGNIHFYGHSGFVVSRTRGIRYQDDPDADYFLIAELEPGFLDGISGSYKDPAGYFVDEAEAEEFDKQFPPKEKLKLPGQLW